MINSRKRREEMKESKFQVKEKDRWQRIFVGLENKAK